MTLALGELLILRNYRTADGRPGLSVRDLQLRFTGGYESLFEARVRGEMRQYLQDGREMSVLAGWAREGAGREEYDRSVASLLDDRCVRCHNAIGQASFRRLDRYELVAAAVRAPSAPSITQQLLVTKVHLAGIGLLLALAIGICWLAGVSTTQIALTTWTGFGGLLVDFGSWWLMRVDLSFAWGRVLGNLLLAVTLVWIAVVALFAMYGRATPKGNQ